MPARLIGGAVEILGRASELAALRRFLVDAREGPCGVVLAGEGGIGKTTLWAAAVADAQALGYRVLACRAVGSEVKLSFAVLGDLLGDVLDDGLPRLPAPQRRAVEVALLLEDAAGASPDARSLGVAVLRLLRIAASEKPVVIAIDDVQWLDRPSRGALAFAVRRLRTEPVSLLVTKRAEAGAPPLHDLEDALPEGRLRELAVAPLTAAELHRLVRDRLGVVLPRSLLQQVYRTSGGNPFYGLELARATELHGGPLGAGEPLPIPASLHELLRARVAAIPRGGHDALLAVACLAEPTIETVEAVTSSAGRTRRGHERAVAAGLLERDGDRIRFTHPLLASSVYVEALPEQRRQMHRRLADVVEDPEARARHLALAATGRDAEAASALEAAALRASARGAPDTASELLELAIELTPERLRSDRDRRRLEAADSYFLAGSIVEGVALLRQLAEELPAGKSRADVLVRLAWRVPRLQETIVLAEQASVESAGDEALLSRTHVVLGTGWPVRGIDATLRHGRRALRHAEASGERRLVVEALARLAHWSLWAGKNPSRLLDRALVLEREDQSQSGRNEPRLPLQLGPQMTLALWRMYQGRLEESRTAFDTVLAEATTRGDEPACVAVEGRLADVALRAGDWPRAEMHVAAALELAEQIGHEHDGGLTLYFKAFLDVHTGCVKAARETAEAAMDAARLANARNTLEMTNAVIGALEISLGNESKALAHLKPLLAWLDETNLGVAMHPLVPYAIEALIAAGELQEARALTARFELEARRLDGPWMSMIGARNRGLIALAAGDILAASDALAAAASYEPPGEWPFEQARTLLALGRLRRRERQKGGARRCFEAALALFESLPAPLWAEVAREELARLGLQRSSTREMTESERRVAELAGSGLTNREVAAKLFMSPKTVEAHLARAYRKLGIRSRAELGARLATQLPDHSRRS